MKQGDVTLVNGDNLNVDFQDFDYVRIVGPTSQFNILSAVARPTQPRVTIYFGSLGNVPFAYGVVRHAQGSIPANRIVNAGYKDIGVLADGSIMELVYDTIAGCWRPILFWLAAVGS